MTAILRALDIIIRLLGKIAWRLEVLHTRIERWQKRRAEWKAAERAARTPKHPNLRVVVGGVPQTASAKAASSVKVGERKWWN